jgi:hypothetical protein
LLKKHKNQTQKKRDQSLKDIYNQKQVYREPLINSYSQIIKKYTKDIYKLIKTGIGGDLLVEEKRGHVRIVLDVDVNEEMMDILKESISKMPEIAKNIIPGQKKKE